MRTIKFRGLRVEGKGWVYGHYYDDELQSFIISGINTYEVIPESVGQFTGLLDIEGKEIYEGDKLSAGESVIVMQYSGRGFEGKYINESQLHDEPIKNNNYLYWKIIGNIHDK
jgi:hypothetical protein